MTGFASRQATRDGLAGSNIEQGFVISLGGMEMWRRVVEEVDADHDAEEDRDDGHDDGLAGLALVRIA
jgi:hypothetical protein